MNFPPIKSILKTLGALGLVVLIVGTYCGYRILFGTPFTLNQLANRQAILFVMNNPEIFTTIGVIDGTMLDFHSGKLAEVGVKKRDAD
jgi:hypothetical protein